MITFGWLFANGLSTAASAQAGGTLPTIMHMMCDVEIAHREQPDRMLSRSMSFRQLLGVSLEDRRNSSDLQANVTLLGHAGDHLS